MERDSGAEIEYFDTGRASEKKKTLIFVIISGCVLLAGLAVFAYLFLFKQEPVVRILDFGNALKGVKIEGTDISGMTREEALSKALELEENELSAVRFTLELNGATYTYGAREMGVVSDYAQVAEDAVSYGHTGTFEERVSYMERAQSEGADFTLTLSVDEVKLDAALAEIKRRLDLAPVNATFEFKPWGYLQDGTEYQPDKDALISTAAKGKKIEYPANITRIPQDQMPNKFRYQFWDTTKYRDKDFIPAAADIARFKYAADVTGISIKTDEIRGQIIEQVKNGAYPPITVPYDVLEASVKLSDLQANTSLIAAWTSSYSSHYRYNRNWNVARMSGIICGVVIEPGVEWSINAQAGPRTVSRGWKKAPGIVDGGYQNQPGGGVCQISSTLYNAAIRAGLGTKSQHHTIRSGYIPAGLDATISSEGPDLKITNPYTVPVYIVSYMNPETKSVTVEIYGPQLTDPDTGEPVIYDFVPGKPSYYGSPGTEYYYNRAELPDGTPIPPGESRVYAEARSGMRVQTYKRFLRLDGTEYKKIEFEKVNLSPITGKVYCNYPDPAAAGGTDGTG